MVREEELAACSETRGFLKYTQNVLENVSVFSHFKLVTEYGRLENAQTSHNER